MSVTAAGGFAASGVACGIRKDHPDLAVVRSLEPATGAAMFTTNRVKAAPLLVSQSHLATAEPQAVVINSGVANAATGPQGVTDAETTAALAADLLDGASEEVLVLSTGLIGVPLPMDQVRIGVQQAVASLSTEGGDRAATAIMTTDTRPKQTTVRSGEFVVGGMAKGSGMIHPALATLLGLITTDYPLESGAAMDMLGPAVESTFNRISIDGDCSTNDAVVLLANGASDARQDDRAFSAALTKACADLARQIVADGEGASVIVEVDVAGAATDAEAKAVASRIATSALVKTAAFGRDPNWGRVLAAAGSAAWNGQFARVDPQQLTVLINGTEVFRHGMPSGREPPVAGDSLRIELDLGLGDARCAYLASDLTYEYVKINSEYPT